MGHCKSTNVTLSTGQRAKNGGRTAADRRPPRRAEAPGICPAVRLGRRPIPPLALTYNGAPSRGGNAVMTLVLTNADVEALLTPRACIEPLDQAYREFALGEAANRARSHTY